MANSEIECNRIIDNYGIDLKNVIGEGSHAMVVRGVDLGKKKPRHVAVKIIAKESPKREADTKLEIEVMKSVGKHKRIVKYFGHSEDATNFYIFMEYISCGSLLSYVTRKGALGEEKARIIFRQILEACQELHNKSICHRDIKLENILYDIKTKSIRLIDFGTSRFLDKNNPEMLTDCVGSPGYVAPEVIGRLEGGYSGFKADVYSLGVVLYALVFGSFPFDDVENLYYYESINQVMMSAMSSQKNGFSNHNQGTRGGRNSLAFPRESIVSRDLILLLNGMLTMNYHDRLSLDEVINHPWVQKRTKFQNFKRSISGFFSSSGPNKLQ